MKGITIPLRESESTSIRILRSIPSSLPLILSGTFSTMFQGYTASIILQSISFGKMSTRGTANTRISLRRLIPLSLPHQKISCSCTKTEKSSNSNLAIGLNCSKQVMAANPLPQSALSSSFWCPFLSVSFYRHSSFSSSVSCFSNGYSDEKTNPGKQTGEFYLRRGRVEVFGNGSSGSVALMIAAR